MTAIEQPLERFEQRVDQDGQLRGAVRRALHDLRPLFITGITAIAPPDGDAEICDGGCDGGGGDEPCRGAHERDAGADGDGADEYGECDAMPVTFEEREETGEDW